MKILFHVRGGQGFGKILSMPVSTFPDSLSTKPLIFIPKKSVSQLAGSSGQHNANHINDFQFENKIPANAIPTSKVLSFSSKDHRVHIDKDPMPTNPFQNEMHFFMRQLSI